MDGSFKHNTRETAPGATDGLGSMLRARRSSMGFTLAEVARRVSCAKSYLSSIETGTRGPPGDELLEKLEHTLGFRGGELKAAAGLERTPEHVREDLESLKARDSAARALTEALRSIGPREFIHALKGSGKASALDALHRSGKLESMIRVFEDSEQQDPAPTSGERASGAGDIEPASLPVEVPLINKVTAGYPGSFTDLGYPARVADEYVRAPDVHDPDAFAARVVGDSMEPEYKEGDVVIFSPMREIASGMDCFLRLEPDHESTFKRVYLEQSESGAQVIRIQPINNAYPPMTVPREKVAGMYAAVSVTRSIGGG